MACDTDVYHGWFRDTCRRRDAFPENPALEGKGLVHGGESPEAVARCVRKGGVAVMIKPDMASRRRGEALQLVIGGVDAAPVVLAEVEELAIMEKQGAGSNPLDDRLPVESGVS